ncbi:glycosyltransferase family 31 protein [Rhexocercosporidium sp. MPI-PUGE-AT-0058]|nr:glycosyltransferase family 31 protein [Rhexocercosporidium sp. MPI-PUGE-AT-0058]
MPSFSPGCGVPNPTTTPPQPYQFSYPVRYVSRDIIVIPSARSERPSLSIIDEPLFEDFITIDLVKSATVDIAKCLPPIHLKVPNINLPTVDASNMIFGLQTTMGRLRDTVKHMERWLPHTNARLFAIVIETEEIAANNMEMANLEKEYHAKGMNVSIIHPVRPGDSFAQRYFSLVNVMYGARNDRTDWVILIDDDTFFPSMHDLQTLLSKYDCRKEQYIGSLSEDWWAVNHYGLMGFGGAGIMLSLPLAKVIDDHTDECKENLRTTAGDITVMDCIYRFSSTKLTHIPALHQVDMHGDLSGFYESGREMISLHHWKSGFKLEIEKMHLVADICDSCFLQRWQFGKDTVLSNGFSIAHYPSGHLSGQKPGGLLGGYVQRINLQEMECTWGADMNVLHSLAPAREKVAEGDKVAYTLLDSIKVDGKDGSAVRQVYFREGGVGNMDTVMVLNWRAGQTSKKDEVKSP